MFDEVLNRLGIQETLAGGCDGSWLANGDELTSVNPSDGQPLGTVRQTTEADYERLIESAEVAFQTWRLLPAPQRGEIVRQIGQELREYKRDLGMLVTLETGKILSEGEGEVQEMIDMCDFAVGLSRQLYGKTMASERPGHRLFEQWHPLGPIGIITAFNFPVAVWSWNAALAAVCGDVMIWKPSPQAPLCAAAVQNIVNRVMEKNGLRGVCNLCVGPVDPVGEKMIADRRLRLISATGSCAMGRHVGTIVAQRLGRCLLELGGNNAVIVTETADLELALRAIVFAAVGAAGQRCTSLRRLIVHQSIADKLTERIQRAYASLKVGDPWEDDVLMGPLISQEAVEQMQAALSQAKDQGGEIVVGGGRIDRPGYFVEPTVVRATPQMEIVRRETFAPILYVMTYADFDEAIAMHNSVDQGLSSGVFTKDLQHAERFLSAAGSDCGIANVNIGTSGAEIGGAFGGEKETGGGREAGSDSWKAYMRRQTCTVNYSDELPLAQGVRFDVS